MNTLGQNFCIVVPSAFFWRSPAPDPNFAVMLRQALCQTRANSLLTAGRHRPRILVHVLIHCCA